jgi:hypothetical protein
LHQDSGREIDLLVSSQLQIKIIALDRTVSKSSLEFSTEAKTSKLLAMQDKSSLLTWVGLDWIYGEVKNKFGSLIPLLALLIGPL